MKLIGGLLMLAVFISCNMELGHAVWRKEVIGSLTLPGGKSTSEFTARGTMNLFTLMSQKPITLEPGALVTTHITDLAGHTVTRTSTPAGKLQTTNWDTPSNSVLLETGNLEHMQQGRRYRLTILLNQRAAQASDVLSVVHHWESQHGE